ncbi:hypothetical protein [Mesorhizobium sp.]|uniref:hypothetical protein n=1 Tax=Mesorhizobium sp. TaxID=1871066 RepID=UPI000FE78C32|nr:hypothetical protein [Mesorhizobium sp.]RWM15687.1 MAG: hypothetical protein EOR74_34420 [Mesorhizobium sp.]
MKRVLLTLAMIGMLVSCRTLTQDERTFLETIYQTDVARRPVDLAAVHVSCLTSSEDEARREIHQRIKSDLRSGTIKIRQASYDAAQLSEAASSSLLSGNGLTIGNNIYFKDEFCAVNLAAGYPTYQDIHLLARLAHEIMHVWQFQNSKITGYSFLRIAIERISLGEAAYDYKPLQPGRPFLAYRFEQQGQIVEDYVVYAHTNPAEAARYRRLISKALDIDAMIASLQH